jgi:hypothetical protein
MKLVFNNATNAKIIFKKITLVKNMWNKRLSNAEYSIPLFAKWRLS